MKNNQNTIERRIRENKSTKITQMFDQYKITEEQISDINKKLKRLKERKKKFNIEKINMEFDNIRIK